MPLNILIIVLSCVALGMGANWLVDSAARIAKKFGVSQLVIGLTIVAFGTSAPEFAVSVAGAVGGESDISVSNIVGSNIFNIGFILGGCALLTALKTKKSLVWRDGGLLLVVTVVLWFMFRDYSLGRIEAGVLFVGLIGYLGYLFWKKEPLEEEEHGTESASWKDGPLLVVGLVLIVGGGYFLKESAAEIALELGMKPWVIGLTVVAAGTSVPEFVISLVAILKQHHGISAGNLVGSNLFNTLGVLGVAGMIRPLGVDEAALTSILALIGLTLLVVIFMRTNWQVGRLEGIVILIVSLAIWGYNIRSRDAQQKDCPEQVPSSQVENVFMAPIK